MASDRSRRWRRRFFRVLIVLVVLAASLEGSIRYLAFGEASRTWPIARALRQPTRYASVRDGDLHWQIQWLLLSPQERIPVPGYDREIGWTGTTLDPATSRHVGEGKLGGRRPVLLYGDSYAQCQTIKPECFESVLDELGLGRRLGMLNYGVGGYGLDQTFLLMKRTVALYADRDPIVVVSILLDDDLDRCVLSFRGWPKPRFRLVDGELELDGEVARTPLEYMEREKPLRTSLAWRLLGNASRRFPWNPPTEIPPELDVEARELTVALLERAVAELESRRVRYFFLLFHHEHSIEDPSTLGWRRNLVCETLDRLNAPWVATDAAMREDAERAGVPISTYFGGSPLTSGHFNALGNQVAFRAFLEGFERFCGVEVTDADRAELDALRGRRVLHVRNYERTVLQGPSAIVRYSQGFQQPFTEPVDGQRIVLRVGERGPTEVHYRLDGRAREFTAFVGYVATDASAGGRVDVVALIDGDERWKASFARGVPRHPLKLDLAGSRELVLRASDGGDGPEHDVVVFGSPALE